MRSIFVAFLSLVVVNMFRFQVTLAIQTLHIGGLYPFSGLSNGRQSSMKGELIRPAVSMAIEDVEKKAILPGYRLHLLVNDTQVRGILRTLAVQVRRDRFENNSLKTYIFSRL